MEIYTLGLLPRNGLTKQILGQSRSKLVERGRRWDELRVGRPILKVAGPLVHSKSVRKHHVLLDLGLADAVAGMMAAAPAYN
jgi:hypothetical protein